MGFLVSVLEVLCYHLWQEIFLKPDVWTSVGLAAILPCPGAQMAKSKNSTTINWYCEIYISGEIITSVILLRVPPQFTHHSLFVHMPAFPLWLVALCYRYPVALWETADRVGNSSAMNGILTSPREGSMSLVQGPIVCWPVVIISLSCGTRTVTELHEQHFVNSALSWFWPDVL